MSGDKMRYAWAYTGGSGREYVFRTRADALDASAEARNQSNGYYASRARVRRVRVTQQQFDALPRLGFLAHRTVSVAEGGAA